MKYIQNILQNLYVAIYNILQNTLQNAYPIGLGPHDVTSCPGILYINNTNKQHNIWEKPFLNGLTLCQGDGHMTTSHSFMFF